MHVSVHCNRNHPAVTLNALAQQQQQMATVFDYLRHVYAMQLMAAGNTAAPTAPPPADVPRKRARPSSASKSRSTRGYSRRQLQTAISVVLARECTVMEASVAYGVPRSTLRNHVNVQGERQGCIQVKHRGKYRQYVSDKLSEAVEHVRAGRMSIHKAGAMYGIPASTLQYKAKTTSAPEAANV